MNGSTIWFSDIPKQLNEMRDFIIKISGDIKELRRELSNRELRKLVNDFKNGVEAINLICIRILAKYEVAKRINKEIHTSPEERAEISGKISLLTDALNDMVETHAMNKFLGKHPELAKKAYMKLYQEGVDTFPLPEEEKISKEEAEKEFLRWIDSIQWYTGILIFELDEAIKKSF